MAARLEIHIRRPPCRHCINGKVPSIVWEGQEIFCPVCKGQSGIVEYSMFLSSAHGMTGRWLLWPGSEQKALRTTVAEILRLG